MIRVGLTGGIATGKSYVLEQFRRHGVPCIDADALAHGVMAAGTEATAAIAGLFGAEILDAEGAVNRRRLGPIVFADQSARRALEAVVHPAVYRSIAAAIRGFELTGSDPLVVVDVPLLFETGHDTDFDRVVATACPADLQLARLRARGLDAGEARQRLAAQMPGDEKAARADFVIRTDGAFADTDHQVADVLQALLHQPPGRSRRGQP